MRRSAASREHQLDLLQHMDRERARPLGDEIEGVGGIVALADAAGGAIAAAVGMLARPALVGFGQGRRGGGQRLGGVGGRLDDRRVLLGDRAVVGRRPRPAAGSFRVPVG